MNKPIEAIPVPRNIYQKLNDSRAEFHAMKLKKSGHNKFAGYFYFELADFLIPALQVFQRNGLCANVSFTPKFATLQIVNIENTAEVIVFASPMAEANLKGCHPIQNLGAVETYQRRYLWVMALEIVEHDAIDSSKPTEEQVKRIAPVAAVVESDSEIQDILNDPEAADYLRTLAAELVQMVEQEGKPEDARKHLSGVQLTNAEKMALWSILAPNSKTRAEIKKKQEESLSGVM